MTMWSECTAWWEYAILIALVGVPAVGSVVLFGLAYWACSVRWWRATR